MDDVPGMKAVLSLLMFPNYKPCGTGEGRYEQEDREERAWMGSRAGSNAHGSYQLWDCVVGYGITYP